MSPKMEPGEFTSTGGVEYWVTCALDPWPKLESDEAFSDIVGALRSDGEYSYDAVELSLVEGGPAFVPAGSVVVHAVGRAGADWDEVMEFLDAMAAAGEGVVFSEDRQIVLDRRTVKPGVTAFKESPAWATALVKKHGELQIVVFSSTLSLLPASHLERVGLAALAKRVGYAEMPRFDDFAKRAGVEASTFQIAVLVVGKNPVDALVAAQVLRHAWRGRAFALGSGGAVEELPA